MLEIKTLGGFSIGVDGHEIKTLNSHKAQALLVYLLIEGRVQQRSVLAAIFWPESPQEEACRSLRVELSKLRKHIGDYVDITRDTVSIVEFSKIQLDFAELQRKLAYAKVDEALDIYKGEFLEGFSIKDSVQFEDWVRNKAALINNQLLEALQGALQDAIVNDDYFNADRYAREILQLDPINEEAHQQTILLYAITGNRPAALSHYQFYADILQNELNLKPSDETRKIYEKIMQGDTVEKGALIRKIRLPAPQTSFIGREQEIQELIRLIRKPDCRLITIIGQGGIGKTRLSIEAARKCARYFSDGVFFVPVETCPSIDHLILAIAKSLELTIDVVINAVGTKSQVFEFLFNRSCLLVLDSFEHLVSIAEFLVELLKFAPKVKLIVNSRESLSLKSEWIFHLEGLAYYSSGGIFFDGQPDAVKLFIARAQQSNSRAINFDDQQKSAVYQICEFVDGMPLGIEMAAAWSDLLQPSEIVQEIQKSLDFLTTNKQDIPEKHHSLRIIFDHTWQGLSEKDKLIFSKMAVFHGEFDLQAAQNILESDLSQLSRLIDRSLLKRNPSGHFFMHALAHQFASEKLTRQRNLFQETIDRFCHYYVELMSQQQEALLGAGMMRARDKIKPFLINFEAALLLACNKLQKIEFMKVLTASLAFFTVYGWHEGVLFLQQLESTRRKFLCESNKQNIEIDEILLNLRLFQAFWLVNLGNIEEAQRISNECLPILHNPEMRKPLSICLHNLGVVASFRGEVDESMRLLEEAVLLGRETDCIFWPTYLFWLGHAYFLKGEYEQGLATLEKSYEIYKRSDTLWGVAFAVSKMGLAEDSLGQHVKALRHQQEGLQTFKQLGYQSGTAYCYSRMSISAFFLGQFEESVQFAQQGYDIFISLGHSWGICTSLCRMGFAHLGLKHTGTAKEKFVESIDMSMKVKMIPVSLYALLGLACVFIIEGKDQIGQALFSYLKSHPKTPQAFLQQADLWMSDLPDPQTHYFYNDESVEDVVEVILPYASTLGL